MPPLLPATWKPSLFLFFIAFFAYVLSGTLISGDTEPAVLLPFSILSEGDLDFNEFRAQKNDLPYWEEKDVPYWLTERDGALISAYPIIPGILNVPIHILEKLRPFPHKDPFQMRYALALITSAWIASLSAVLMLHVFLSFTKTSTAMFFGFVYALATPMWHFAGKVLWQHGPGALFISGALYCIIRGTSRWATSATGAFLVLACWTRPTNVVVAAALALFVVLRRKTDFVPLLLGAAGPLALFAWYAIGFHESLASLGQGLHSTASFDLSVFPEAFAGLLISPNRGLFVYTPIFLFCLPVMARSIRHPQRHLLLFTLTCGVIGHIVLYSFWPEWWGGQIFGNRFLVEIIPLLMVLLVHAWEEDIRHSKMMTRVFGAFLFVSLMIQIIGAHTYPCGTLKDEYDIKKDKWLYLWSIGAETQLVRCVTEFVDSGYVYPAKM